MDDSEIEIPKIVENGMSRPKRVTNMERRPREYLTEREVDRLIDAASQTSTGVRDAAMILIGYRHGMRVSELCNLRWSQIDIEMQSIHVHRLKRGKPSMQPLGRREIEALEALRHDKGPYVFISRQSGPVKAATFRKMIARIGEVAGFNFPIHPHMLRHACGYKLANDGIDTRAIQDYLGHRNLNMTTRYTELAAGRFKGFFGE